MCFIYVCTVLVCIFTIQICYDFTIKTSRKSPEINFLTISGYYLDRNLTSDDVNQKCENFSHYDVIHNKQNIKLSNYFNRN